MRVDVEHGGVGGNRGGDRPASESMGVAEPLLTRKQLLVRFVDGEVSDSGGNDGGGLGGESTRE